MKKYLFAILFALVAMNSFGIMVAQSACSHPMIIILDPSNNMYESMFLNRGDKITITWETSTAISVAIMDGANHALCENGYSHSYVKISPTSATSGTFVYNVIRSDIYYAVIASGSYSGSVWARVELAVSWTSYLWLLFIPFGIIIIWIVKRLNDISSQSRATQSNSQ